MENKQPNVYVPAREIDVITGEIKELCRQATVMMLSYAVEIGRRLVEAKSVLPHGEWGRYLKETVNFSQSSANNYMKLFEEYGKDQISVFGAIANSQTFANLPYSKALKLLAIPEDEREEFAQAVGADQLSVRQLEEAIRDREEKLESANARAEKAEAEAAETKDAMEKVTETLDETVKKAVAEAEERMRATVERANDVARSADIAYHELSEKLDSINEQYEAQSGEVKKLSEEAERLKGELEAAKKNPKIPKAKLDALRAEAEAAVKAEAEAASSKALEELKEQKEEAERKKEEADKKAGEAAEKLEAAQKALRVADPAVVEFKAVFETLQDVAGKAKAKLDVIRGENPEVAEKLGMALKRFGESL